jgi:hypothetical protein
MHVACTAADDRGYPGGTLSEPWLLALRDIMCVLCEQVTEVPLVFDDASESISKTSAAVKLLQTVSRLPDTSDAPRSCVW